MTTVTINDKEYDYDTFTETQIAIITELSTCDAEIKRVKYANAVYSARSDELLKALMSSLEDINTDQAETESQ